MSAIQNRYEFVYFFDVTNGNPTVIPMRAICRASIPNPAKAWSLTSA